MYPTIDLEKIKGIELGRGSNKIVYCHKEHPDRCLKICLKNKATTTIKEIEYFKFLKKRQIQASFIPEFYGAFEGDNYIGLEQESFTDKQNGGQYDSVRFLSDCICDPASNLEEIMQMLDALKNEMIQSNVIVSDLHGRNIFRIVKGQCIRLVIIDGYGSPEAFPLPQYFRFLGKMKIERQWKKLMRRLQPVFHKRLQAENLGKDL